MFFAIFPTKPKNTHKTKKIRSEKHLTSPKPYDTMFPYKSHGGGFMRRCREKKQVLVNTTKKQLLDKTILLEMPGLKQAISLKQIGHF